MNKDIQEKRGYPRHQRRLDMFCHYAYDMKIPLHYQVFTQDKYQSLEKMKAYSKNISVNGLGIIVEKMLKIGASLNIELFLPDIKMPVHMVGEVQWLHKISKASKAKGHFEAGLRIREVEGQPVDQTIYNDQTYHVAWSALLESVFGLYRIASQEKHRHA